MPAPPARWATTSPKVGNRRVCLVRGDITSTSPGAPHVFPARPAITLMSLGLLPAEHVRKAILAPSKMQLFVCLACLDHFATPPAAQRVCLVPGDKRLFRRHRRSARLAPQVCSKVPVTTNASSAGQENTSYSGARRAVTCAQKITSALAQMCTRSSALPTPSAPRAALRRHSAWRSFCTRQGTPAS